ncbi:MAG: hypothetical protein KC620_22455, partial [Myxococcales bacterium]|nr:hypothetical protein [Myxococcales bacterium]
MKLDTLAALYVLVGAGAVVVLAARRGLDGRLWLDGPLLLICWPLYGPFLAMGDGAREPALLGALRVAREGPLAALLPDGDALER